MKFSWIHIPYWYGEFHYTYGIDFERTKTNVFIVIQIYSYTQGGEI